MYINCQNGCGRAFEVESGLSPVEAIARRGWIMLHLKNEEEKILCDECWTSHKKGDNNDNA